MKPIDELTLDKLNRAIAEAQGFDIVPVEHYNPGGEYTLFYLKDRESGKLTRHPFWSTDNDAALGLLAECGYNLNPPDFDAHDDELWHVMNDLWDGLYHSSAPTPAEAIACAWLAWKAEQDG